MKLPKVKHAQKLVGLYVIDFGDHSGVGFTTDEVAELLESEKFQNITVYKIHKAYPDGRMELKGIRREIFQLEMGMFFYSSDENSVRQDFKHLIDLAIRIAPPARAKVHLAKYDKDRFTTALIYPAEYNNEISQWLLDGDYKTAGLTEGGFEAVQRYYYQTPEILQRHQLFADAGYLSKSGEELLVATKLAVQR